MGEAAPRGPVALDLLTGDELDDEDVMELAQNLRSELLDLNLDAVEFASTDAPVGSKADVATLSTLLLTLAASGGVLTSVIGTLRDWLLRQPTPITVEVSIGSDTFRVEGATSSEREQLLAAFVAKHDPPPK
jgi:hypothetical protein